MSKAIHRKENEVLIQLIRTLRREAGLSQEQCCWKLGRPQSFMSDVERGVRRLDLVQVRDLCTVFGISLQEFVRRYDESLRDQYEYEWRDQRPMR